MPDLYNDLIQMKEHFDLSNFDPSKRYYQPDFGTTKAVVAKMEEERRAIVITEFEGFRPPISPFEIVWKKADGKLEKVSKQRAKGIQRSGVPNLDEQQFLE